LQPSGRDRARAAARTAYRPPPRGHVAHPRASARDPLWPAQTDRTEDGATAPLAPRSGPDRRRAHRRCSPFV